MEPHTRLVALRKRLGILQETLADALGIPRPRVSTMEHGGKKLDDYRIMEVLARVFVVRIEDLAAYLLKAEIDLDELLRRRESAPRPTKPSNLDIAIAYLGDSISDEAIVRVRREAATGPDRSPQAWGKTLARVQADVLAKVAEP